MCQALNHSRGTHATGIGSLLRRLARRSLKPQLNQIRTWVRQGRTDAWIAHQLEVSVGDIRSFKREHELVPGEGPTEGDDGAAVSEELDLRAEDDALVAAALEAEQEAGEEVADEDAADEEASDEGDERGRATTTSPSVAAAAGAAGVGAPGASSRRWRAPSTTATRATASGSTPRSRTIPSTPSTGPATVR